MGTLVLFSLWRSKRPFEGATEPTPRTWGLILLSPKRPRDLISLSTVVTKPPLANRTTTPLKFSVRTGKIGTHAPSYFELTGNWELSMFGMAVQNHFGRWTKTDRNRKRIQKPKPDKNLTNHTRAISRPLRTGGERLACKTVSVLIAEVTLSWPNFGYYFSQCKLRVCCQIPVDEPRPFRLQGLSLTLIYMGTGSSHALLWRIRRFLSSSKESCEPGSTDNFLTHQATDNKAKLDLQLIFLEINSVRVQSCVAVPPNRLHFGLFSVSPASTSVPEYNQPVERVKVIHVLCQV